MNLKKGRERRLHPRINKHLPIKVAVNGYDFSTSTQNVSCLGAYCNIKKYIPPFTKVMVRLKLPILTKSGAKNSIVECKGVLVRTEDDAKGGFNIAIFFNDINETQKNRISRYVNQFLPENTCALKRN